MRQNLHNSDNMTPSIVVDHGSSVMRRFNINRHGKLDEKKLLKSQVRNTCTLQTTILTF
jgi:hypothetical protein